MVSAAHPLVQIPGCGSVQGIQRPAVAKFLNIPYATVVKRWRPSVKAAPWSGVRDATVQGPVCHQPKSENPMVSMASGDVDEDDEEAYSKIYNERDCLNLNIFAPRSQLPDPQGKPSGPPVPVMVWIHGGGFKDGGNGMELYDASNLVDYAAQTLGRPVIVVTINYRLNYFGFLSSAELVSDVHSWENSSPQQQDPMNKSVGNWGLLDQKLALEWVRDHIAAFGGDPTNVTAFGESAGACSIGYHIGMPAHHGLFQRAIFQSGASTTLTTVYPELEGQRYFDNLCNFHGLNDPKLNLSGAQKLERLSRIPAKDLVKAADNGRVGMFQPCIDGVLIKSDVRGWIHDPALYDTGLKSVMLGDCRDEGSMFVVTMGAPTLKRWSKFKSIYCPPSEEKAFDQIYGVPKSDAEAFATSALTVEEMQLGLGAHHAVELPFVFGSDQFLDLLTDEEKVLSQSVMENWVLFAWGETGRRHGLRRGLDSFLPSDVGCGGDRMEAIVFTEECTVEKKLVERMDQRTIEYWKRYEQWVKEQRLKNATERQNDLSQATRGGSKL
ncbi:hypothetical protein BGW38_003710 [Lunasporangiospora selenospora]|uniref:Carboxylesterase type B domain-containing protein n=1 Tax=Lunasporangiospora selenospora TaxID=979761 RepID=A0A9P6FR28_9FUNG|nr:hypothetical protein BGW38_003710 [Lunasporangiospora selenospora]